METEHIAGRLTQVRKRLKLSQRLMAERLGVPLRSLQDNERGVSVPGGRVLAAYAELGADVNWLLVGVGAPFRPRVPVAFETGEAPGDVRDVADLHDQTRIVIPFFAPTEIRRSYIVDRQERLRRGVLSLAPEWLERMIPVRELGLPDRCRLIATEVADDAMEPRLARGSLLLVNAGREWQPDSRCHLILDGTLLVARNIEPVGQRAVIRSERVGATEIVSRAVITRRVIGPVIGFLRPGFRSLGRSL